LEIDKEMEGRKGIKIKKGDSVEDVNIILIFIF